MKRTVNKTSATHVKRALMALILVMMTSLAIIGCKKDKKPEDSLKDNTDKAVTDEKKDTGREETADNKKPRAGALIDITSKEDIDKFLTGKWRLVDTVGGKEFATLVIYDDGKCEYDRDTDNFLVEGDFSVKKHQTFDEKTDELIDDEQYTGFDLSFYDVPEDFNPPGQDYYKVENESVDGNFHIARGDGYDYLYLEWVGNGDSYIFGFMFQDAERIRKEYDKAGAYTPQGDMVFRRANEGLTDTEPVEDDKFFGLIWENAGNSLWVQTMDVHTCESEDEYTGRRYKKAYFTEQKDLGLKEYRLAKDADTSLVLNTAQLKKEHPVMMCGLETDERGQIIRINEVDKAIYGSYDLGSTGQEYSYDGLKFTMNGCDYDLKEHDSEANGIADMKQVGDWIVVKADVPPHYSEYYLVNIYSGNLEKTINGENLTWVDDDITTAVYSSGSCIYNFKDHVIGTTDGAEVRDLKLRSGGKEVIARDDNDETYSFELEDDDEAMYRYADFAVEQTARSWKKFMDCAPEDAIAYVMVSPPDVVKKRLSWLQKVDEGSSESVYVVALKDGTVIHADSGVYDVDNNRFDTKKTFDRTELLKGYSRGYEIFVPEGIPYNCIYISAGDEGGIFPIATISGRSDQCGMFIISSMTGEEALETSTAGR